MSRMSYDCLVRGVIGTEDRVVLKDGISLNETSGLYYQTIRTPSVEVKKAEAIE